MINSRKRAQRCFNRFCKSRKLENFNSIAQIVHSDGSTFILHYATVWWSREKFKSEGGVENAAWIGVCTEHNGDFLFNAGDILDYWVR